MFYLEEYGHDADNNRWMEVINFDITEDDKEEILEAIYPLFMDDNLGEVVVPLYCFITDDFVDVVININDYLEDLIEMGLSDEEYKEEQDIQEWLNDLKENLKGESNEKA